MHFDVPYLSMVLGIVGTTIAPWMQFYMQSAVIEKGIKVENYRYAVWDVVVGCVATVVVAFFIMVACAATLHVNGVVINEAKDAAMSLKPFAGASRRPSSSPSACSSPRSSRRPSCPWPRPSTSARPSASRRASTRGSARRPQFYALFGFIMGLAVVIILIPGAPLIGITIWTQVLNAMMLPVVLISMIRMVNNKKIMGTHVNNVFQNAVGWTSTVVLLALTATLLISQVVQMVVKK